MNTETPKAVIVTGSTSGIGFAIASRLYAEGWRVTLNGYRTEKEGADLCAKMPGADYVDADVSNSDGAAYLVKTAIASFGQLDAVVNNAGVAWRIDHSDLDAVDDEIWDKIMAVNLKGPWNVAKAARPHLARSSGQIINNASLAGLTTTGSSIPYAVSKAGLVHLTHLLAKALGPEIRVNAVAPGYIDTPLTHEWQSVRDYVEDNAPARRLGDPEDVAEAVHGVMNMGYVSGAIIPVAGGLQVL